LNDLMRARVEAWLANPNAPIGAEAFDCCAVCGATREEILHGSGRPWQIQALARAGFDILLCGECIGPTDTSPTLGMLLVGIAKTARAQALCEMEKQ
jgi:hypothetical protein